MAADCICLLAAVALGDAAPRGERAKEEQREDESAVALHVWNTAVAALAVPGDGIGGSVSQPLDLAIVAHFERLEVMADYGLMIVVYTAEPGSRSAQSLDLLASWAATEAEGLASNDPGAHRAGGNTSS